MSKSVLFIEGQKGFINQAIINNLERAGFRVVRISESVDSIMQSRFEADILLYYPSNDSDIPQTLLYLADLCRTGHKTLSVIGEAHHIRAVSESQYSDRVSGMYARPIDISKLTDDLLQLSDAHSEYDRKKRILVADDDNDFLTVIKRWLSEYYLVDTVRSGTEALFYLSKLRPDLLLLDYEMPELDGYQVLDGVRANVLTREVPVIFLTGKNDRETVMKIIRKKPDGYLLKSMSKDNLLDSLDRFFADTILMTQNTL